MSFDVSAAALQFLDDVVNDEGHTCTFKNIEECVESGASHCASHKKPCPFIDDRFSLPRAAVAKVPLKNIGALFGDKSMLHAPLSEVSKKLGAVAAASRALADCIEKLDVPMFVWELELGSSQSFMKGLKAFLNDLFARGFVCRMVEIGHCDLDIPYNKNGVFVYGVSLSRFEAGVDVANSWLDLAHGFIDRAIARTHNLVGVKDFLSPEDCSEVQKVKREISSKIVKGSVPSAFFSKLHEKGIEPGDCIPDRSFEQSSWFNCFSEKEKMLVSYDRLVFGDTLVASDLAYGVVERENASRPLIPQIRGPSKIFLWGRQGLLLGDELMRIASVPVDSTSAAIVDRLSRLSEDRKTDIAAQAANGNAIVLILLVLMKCLPIDSVKKDQRQFVCSHFLKMTQKYAAWPHNAHSFTSFYFWIIKRP